jgi:flagellar hook-basal body complex protein FliE
MDLATINTQIASAVSAATGAAKSGAIKGAASAGPGSDFASSLDAALKSVSQAQANAAELQKQFQMENPNVGLEDAVIAMSKANLSFSAAVQVRNRLVQAYDQVMNMQV